MLGQGKVLSQYERNRTARELRRRTGAALSRLWVVSSASVGGAQVLEGSRVTARSACGADQLCVCGGAVLSVRPQNVVEATPDTFSWELARPPPCLAHPGCPHLRHPPGRHPGLRRGHLPLLVAS